MKKYKTAWLRLLYNIQMDILKIYLSFANNIDTHEGGAHLAGFKAALTKTVNDYAKRNKLLKENDENLSGEDIREGLTAVISVKISRPSIRRTN